MEYLLSMQGPGPCVVACEEIAEGEEENQHNPGNEQ